MHVAVSPGAATEGLAILANSPRVSPLTFIPRLLHYLQLSRAIGIEHVPELVDSATKAVGRIDWARDLMRKGQLSFQVRFPQQPCLP